MQKVSGAYFKTLAMLAKKFQNNLKYFRKTVDKNRKTVVSFYK